MTSYMWGLVLVSVLIFSISGSVLWKTYQLWRNPKLSFKYDAQYVLWGLFVFWILSVVTATIPVISTIRTELGQTDRINTVTAPSPVYADNILIFEPYLGSDSKVMHVRFTITQAFIDEVAAIDGIASAKGVYGNRYQILLTKGKLYQWPDIEKQIEAIVKRVMKGTNHAIR